MIESIVMILDALAPWATLVVIAWFFLWTTHRQASVIESLSKKIMAMHNPFALQAFHYEQSLQNGNGAKSAENRVDEHDWDNLG